MKRRTDKPTANVIVVNHTDSDIYDILRRIDGKYYLYTMFGAKEIPIDEIKKWADLEENEVVTDCHQLEEAARNSWFNYEFDCGALYSKCYKDGFKAGANWQNEQDHDACYQCEKNYDNVFYKGEQHAIKMMKKEAIEGKCVNVGNAGAVIDTDYGCLFLPPESFKVDDMVKVIILRDE